MLVSLLLLALTFPYSWEEQGVKITLVHPEVTRDKRYVLVHLRVQASMDVAAFRWQNLVQVINREGQSVSQANDCGVDRRITMGQFLLRKGQKSEVLLYYLSQPADFPVQIMVGEQAVGSPLGR
jgi:hypothetical protein